MLGSGSNVLVLGCGPAGLLAAHAVRVVTGTDAVIFSKKRKSEIFGAQYLHESIPGLVAGDGTEPTLITYELRGDSDDYREKVYGDKWRDRTSPDDLPGEHYGWDIRAAYNELWSKHESQIEDVDLTAEQHISHMTMIFDSYDLVISSIPKPVLCIKGHQFASQKVWAIGDAPERGVFCPVEVPNYHVVCNGEDSPSWYRASRVFGYRTAEWPENSQPPIPGVTSANKPLFNQCDCWPNVLHVGRFGRWEKGILSHSAFFDVVSALLPDASE